MKRRQSFLIVVLACSLILSKTYASGAPRLSHDFLDSIRQKYNLPAIGCAVIVSDSLSFMDVTGLRKLGDTISETLKDTWHLGSDTKAFTAAMIGKLVERRVLSYSSTIGQLFPELKERILPVYQNVTLDELLEHRAGLWHDWPDSFTRTAFDTLTGTLRERRLKFLQILLSQPPAFSPGSKYNYSNMGYVIAAAMAEHAANKQYEALMDEIIFRPLGITSAGWGLMNTPQTVDNTWEHFDRDSLGFIPVDNVDNPLVDNPAGRLHMNLLDWTKFIRSFLPDSRNQLATPAMERLTSLPDNWPEGERYRDGWTVLSRPWAKGIALNHAGSNGLNFANVWIAPNRRFAVMVTVNAGGPKAQAAAEEIIDRAILPYLP